MMYLLNGLPAFFGTINITGNIIISGQGLFANGTNAAPSISFQSDPDTGIYLDASNTLGIATAGVGTLLFSSSAGIGKIKAHGTRVLALEAGTGNTNITLTPSGTGTVVSTNVNFDVTSSLVTAEVYCTAAFAIGRGGSIALGGLVDGSNSSTFAAIAGQKESAVSGATGGYLGLFTRANGAAMTERARILSTGRFLLGTTTDSGALLQIGTNSTSNAGGIVFGTDTFAFRSAAGRLSLYGSAGSGLRIESLNYLAGLLHSGNTPGTIADAPHLCIQSPGGSVYVASSGTLALTLDSSQNATFAGTVKSSVSTGSRTIQLTPTVTVAPDAVQNLVSQNYGFFLVNENVLTGSIAIIGFNSGGTYIVWQEGTNYSTTANTASKFNVYYSAGTQLVVQNKKASNATFNIINLAGGS